MNRDKVYDRAKMHALSDQYENDGETFERLALQEGISTNMMRAILSPYIIPHEVGPQPGSRQGNRSDRR